jgi:hypothetical protein
MCEKIVCIEPYDNNESTKRGYKSRGHIPGGLTYGKEYEVVNYAENLFDEFVEIINNFGHNTEYLRSRFVSKEEWREMKLKELGL